MASPRSGAYRGVPPCLAPHGRTGVHLPVLVVLGHTGQQAVESATRSLDRGDYQPAFVERQFDLAALFDLRFGGQRSRNAQGQAIPPLLHLSTHELSPVCIYNEDTLPRTDGQWDTQAVAMDAPAPRWQVQRASQRRAGPTTPQTGASPAARSHLPRSRSALAGQADSLLILTDPPVLGWLA